MQATQVLHKIMKKSASHLHKTRRQALETVVLSALEGRRLTVTDLGRSIRSGTTHKHQIKRADRLLSNPYLHKEGFELYKQLCHQLMGARTRPIVLIDWSDMDDHKQHFILRAALAVEGRAHTLYEEVHTLATKEKRQTHKTFLHQLKVILPQACRPVLVTDAGFRTMWFKQVQARGWDWVGRIRNRHDMRWEQGGPWFDAKKCYSRATSCPTFLGHGVLTQRHQLACQFILYKGKAQGRHHKTRFGDRVQCAHSRKIAMREKEPWLLATSLPSTSTLAKAVVKYYKARMQIEESFRDVKSHRFGLGLNYHRTQHAKRLQVLLLIATLALMVLWILGQAIRLAKRHYAFQANSVRDRNVLSVIFIGIQMAQQTRIKIPSYYMDKSWEQLRDSVIETSF